MYQTYEDKLVISVNQWIEAGLSKNIFEHESKRGRLKIVQRALHGNTLIDVRSIKRLDIRKTIEATHGIIEEEAKTVPFIEEIHLDQSAHSFFSSYRYGANAEKSLPSKDDNNVVTLYSNHAAILNAVKVLMERKIAARGKSINKFRHGEWWKLCVNFAKVANTSGWVNTLPKNPQAFERLFKEYLNRGCGALVSGKYGNNNTEKIAENAGEWLVARYAAMINRVTVSQLFAEYNIKALNEGWKPLKSDKTIHNYLHKPEVEILWYGARHGELLAKQRFAPQHRTLLPSMRDSVWYGDGTKLNYYYRDECGNVATCNVYEVIDAYSECLLGYHISKTEDFEQQYKAYRKALDFSGHKPYEVRFDNQGGHKKLASGNFLKKMAHLCIATMPYNGNSKTIEYAFKDFQSRYLHKDWFFTGQNITAKKQESKANKEMIDANKANLYTLDEITKVYEIRRNEWNQAPHPKTGVARIQMYYGSQNPQAKKIEMWERISLFGIMTEKPSTFRAGGVEIVVKGEKYAYDVLDRDNFTDYEFRNRNTGKKFFVEYDLEDMRIVNLYEQTAAGVKFVTMAEKYIVIHRGKQEQDEVDAAMIALRDKKNKEMRVSLMDNIEDTLEKHNLHPSQHGLNMPKIRGVKNTQRYAHVSRAKHEKDSFGKMLKDESNICELEETIRDNY